MAGQSDAVRPGPVRQKVHIPRHLVAGAGQQTVIVLGSARIQAGDRSVCIHARRRWVRYFQQTPEILRTAAAVGLKRGALGELGRRTEGSRSLAYPEARWPDLDRRCPKRGRSPIRHRLPKEKDDCSPDAGSRSSTYTARASSDSGRWAGSPGTSGWGTPDWRDCNCMGKGSRLDKNAYGLSSDSDPGPAKL